MTQNEILALLHKVVAENQQFTTWTVSTPHLVALVNQAVEQEREECAKICDSTVEQTYISGYTGAVHSGRRECAEAIRARGEPASRGKA
jgi:hypothetical protein